MNTSKMKNNTMRISIVIFIVLFFLFFADMILFKNLILDSVFAPLLDPFIALGTFVLAIYLGWQKRNDNLEKRITVHFKIKDSKTGEFKYLLTCHEAFLAGESDIRSWSQQIGSQMTGERYLDFYPYMEETSSVTKEKKVVDGKVEEGKRIKLHEVTFFLRKYPKKPQKSNEQRKAKGHLSQSRNMSNVKVLRRNTKPKKKQSAPNFHTDYTVWWDNNPVGKVENQVWTGQGVRDTPLSVEEALEKKKEQDAQKQSNAKKKGLLNLSNHPSTGWSEQQIQAAEQEYGEVIDMPFPNIPSLDSSEDLDKKVLEHLLQIKEKNVAAVHIAGEQTFVFRLVKQLKNEGIPCIASTSERNVEYTDDNTKKITFSFQQFREF